MRKIASNIYSKLFGLRYGKSINSIENINKLLQLLERVLYDNVQGSIIEFGVYKGGTLLEIAKLCKKLKSKKIIYGLDTFEGHPYTDKGTEHIKGYLKSNFNSVKKIFRRYNNIFLIKGMFKYTMPIIQDETFCFAHVDCDLYESYIEVLGFLKGRMERDSIILFDDYNSKTATKSNEAIEKFFSKSKLLILKEKGAYVIA